MNKLLVEHLLVAWWLVGWVPCAILATYVMRRKGYFASRTVGFIMELIYGFILGPLPLLDAAWRGPKPVRWQVCPYCYTRVPAQAVVCAACSSWLTEPPTTTPPHIRLG